VCVCARVLELVCVHAGERERGREGGREGGREREREREREMTHCFVSVLLEQQNTVNTQRGHSRARQVGDAFEDKKRKSRQARLDHPHRFLLAHDNTIICHSYTTYTLIHHIYTLEAAWRGGLDGQVGAAKNLRSLAVVRFD